MASIGDLVVNLTADSTKMNSALASAEKGLMAFGTAVAAAAGLAVTRFLQVGSALDDMSQRTGVSVEALSGLGYVAKLSDTNLESLQGSLIKMSKVLAEAQSGSQSASEALDAIGVSASQLQTMAPEQQFAAIADGIARIQDPSRKTKAAMDVFGKSAAEIIPLLNQGSAGIEAMMTEAEQLGLIMDSKTAEASAKTADAIDRLVSSVDMAIAKFGQVFAPVLMTVANSLAFFIGQNEKLIRILASAAIGIAVFAAAYKALTLVTQAYAKAQAIAQALSGPKGWVILAGAALAATAAIATLNSQFAALNQTMDAAQANATNTGAALSNIGKQDQQSSLDAKAKRITELVSPFAGNQRPPTDEVQKFRLQMSRLTDDFRQVEFFSRKLGVNMKDLQQYKAFQAREVSGFNSEVQDLTNQLRVLRGEVTEVDLQMERFAAFGVPQNEVDRLKAMNAERQRLLDKQQEEQQLLADREASEAKLLQLAQDREQAMKSEADAILESLKTPEQLIQDQTDRIQELQQAGLLTAQQAAAAVAKLQAKQQDGSQLTTATGNEMAAPRVAENKFAQAMERGSASAFSTILANMRPNRDAQVQAIQNVGQILKNNVAAPLQDIKNNTKPNFAPEFA